MKRFAPILLVFLAACANADVISPSPAAISGVTPTSTNTPVSIITSTPKPDEFIDEKGVQMRLVAAGEFTMGSDADDALAECQKYRKDCQRAWFMDQEPAHPVSLDAFYMDQYEVTNAHYKTCVAAHVCKEPSDTYRYNAFGYTDHPVVYVDWNQAKAYCEWRGARLPTEAEWEKAARGTDGRTYPWGEGISCDRANYYDSLHGRFCVGDSVGYPGDTTPVGSYESGVSPYGIYDLAGNVWEWVADWYSESYYPSSPASNPVGPDSGEDRVVRGGASNTDRVDSLGTANRNKNDPDFSHISFGFRCARDTTP